MTSFPEWVVAMLVVGALLSEGCGSMHACVRLIPASRSFCLSPRSCSLSEPEDSFGVSVFARVVLSGM